MLHRTARAAAVALVISLLGAGTLVGPVSAAAPVPKVAPEGVATALVAMTAPSTPGSYLLVLDVVSPTHGPISALGSEPAIVRVTVGEAAAPTPVPTPLPPQLRD